MKSTDIRTLRALSKPTRFSIPDSRGLHLWVRADLSKVGRVSDLLAVVCLKGCGDSLTVCTGHPSGGESARTVVEWSGREREVGFPNGESFLKLSSAQFVPGLDASCDGNQRVARMRGGKRLACMNDHLVILGSCCVLSPQIDEAVLICCGGARGGEHALRCNPCAKHEKCSVCQSRGITHFQGLPPAFVPAERCCLRLVISESKKSNHAFDPPVAMIRSRFCRRSLSRASSLSGLGPSV